MAATPFTSRSAASTCCTGSLKATVMFVRLVRLEPRNGTCVATIGGTVFTGGTETMTAFVLENRIAFRLLVATT